MTDIQRWDMNHVQGEVYIDKNPEGSWVTFTDAEAAIAAARDDAIAAAVQRVEALIDPWPNTSPGVIRRGNVFAAIKGDSDD
jgi:hypothetical protein